jgi:hypothetical protein
MYVVLVQVYREDFGAFSEYFWRILQLQYDKMLRILRKHLNNKEYDEKICSSMMPDDFKGTVSEKIKRGKKLKLAYKKRTMYEYLFLSKESIKLP